MSAFDKWADGIVGIEHTIISPLSVPVSKKNKFILNVNNYRNAHYHVLNKAKITYRELISGQLKSIPELKMIAVTYILSPSSKRKTDLDNVICIHKKFFQDALVLSGKIPDDSYEYIKYNNEYFGCISKENPRVEVTIMELDK